MTYTHERYKQLEKMGLIPKDKKWRDIEYGFKIQAFKLITGTWAAPDVLR